MAAGDVQRMLTPGGGGRGAPAAVRPMMLDDVAAVQRVERSAGELFRSFPEPRVAACADHEPMPADDLAVLAGGGRAWVVVDGDQVVGFLALRVVDGAAHVEEVSVDPRFGGRGHATRLLEEAASWAPAQRLAAVTLTTFRDVPWNRPFYERRGYRVLEDDEMGPVLRDLMEEEDERYGLPRELRVVMRRDLRPPVEVRDALGEDLRDIRRLFNALIPTTTVAWRDHLASEEEIETWFAGQEAAGHPVLVATVSEVVVGYTAWTGFRYSERFPGYGHSMELTIHVDGSHHGAGVGRTLVEALVDRARVRMSTFAARGWRPTTSARSRSTNASGSRGSPGCRRSGGSSIGGSTSSSCSESSTASAGIASSAPSVEQPISKPTARTTAGHRPARCSCRPISMMTTWPDK